MSQLNVDNIKDRSGSSLGPTFPNGMRVAAGSTLNVYGDMVVEGTQTVINTDVLDVKDKTVGIASTSNPTAMTQDGAGLEIYGPSNVTVTYSGQKAGVGINTGLDVAGFGTFSGSVTATGAVSGSTFTATGTGAANFGGSLSVGSSIGAGGSITATTFYGSAAGLTNQSGGLDAIDVWKLQGNDNQMQSTGLFQRLKQSGASAATVCCIQSYLTCKDMSDRPKWFTGPAVGAGITYVQQEGTGYTSNTDCFSGKDYDKQALAGVVKFPSTGLWRIDWRIMAAISASCNLRIGIECSCDVGAATTVWTGLYPDNWNCCNIEDPSWWDGSNRSSISGFAMCNNSGSASGVFGKDISVLVSVADTAKTGIRYSYWRDRSATQLLNQTTWTYTKVGTTAPW